MRPADTAAIPLPYLVAVNLTQRCNLNCAHCYMDAERRTAAPEGELTTAEIADLQACIGSRAPGTIIVLTGGEPLLRDDIEELVEAGARAGLRVVIGTNGVLLTGSRIDRLQRAGLSGVGISLDSVHAAQHDAFRGVDGSFRKACTAVRLCVSRGLHAQVHFTVTRANRDQLEAMVALAMELGAPIINFFFLVCTGRAGAIVDLTPEQYEEALNEIARLQEQSRGIMVQTRCAPHFKRILYERDPASPYTRATGYDGGGCLAATRYCRVDWRGEVTPCPYMELSVGNILKSSFWQIWDQAPLFQSMRAPVLSGRCGECEFRLLCGGCRARSLVQLGDLLGEDNSCAYLPAGRPVVASVEPVEEAPGFRSEVRWSEEARRRLKRIPVFLRARVQKKLEQRAAEEGVTVTPEFMQRYRAEREQELGIRFE